MPDKKIKLLIADDHRLFVSGLKHILSDHADIGTPDYVLDGKEGIHQCRNQQYDIVLMDINMPLIDGIEATREIKRFDPYVKILIVSMLSDLETVSKVLKAGADGFMIKNAEESEFIKAFQVMRRDEIYLSPTLSELFMKDRTGKTIIKEDYIEFAKNIVTPREKLILKMIAEGHTSQFIADTLSLSVNTVDTHRNNMLAKLNLPNTAALVRFAFENKLV